MTRTIKASEVKPGMTIRWDSGGITYQCKVGGLFPSITSGLVSVEAAGGGYIPLSRTQPVTVLSEPAPAQPEEPTEFGARVRVRDGRFVRLGDADLRRHLWHEEGTGYLWSWDDLCEMGPVTVIPDQGWTVPDTLEVPERIDEWDTWEEVPEGVTVSNPELNYQYRKACGKIETISPISGGVWGETSLPLWTYPGPWERVTDA